MALKNDLHLTVASFWLLCFILTATLGIISCNPTPVITINNFQVTPSSITEGESATLRWSVTGATVVKIDNGIGEVSSNGVSFVKPSATTTYIITAINSSSIVQDNTTIIIKSKPLITINYFQVNPSSITEGESATLRWSVTGATGLKIDNSIGEVSSNGVLLIEPSDTTTYIITAINASRIVRDNATIIVKSKPPPPPSNTVKALVTKVVDGDTIWVEMNGIRYKVRYIGMDTPETVNPSKPKEYFGTEASQKNKELVGGKTVYLEKDVSEKDRYGRLLRYVWTTDGTMVNAELVRLGYAYSYSYPPDIKYQDLFVLLQREARENCRGLWAKNTPD